MLLFLGIRFAVAGGDLAPPPAVERLLRRLPPPHCFAGPFVVVDGLLSHLGNIILPDKCGLLISRISLLIGDYLGACIRTVLFHVSLIRSKQKTIEYTLVYNF